MVNACKDGFCNSDSVAGGYAPYTNEMVLASQGVNTNLSGESVIIPQPEAGPVPLTNGDHVELYDTGTYGKVIVLAQSFDSLENSNGPKSASQMVCHCHSGTDIPLVCDRVFQHPRL